MSSTPAGYAADEWTQIRQAPLLMGLVVVTASPSGPVGLVKELLAVGKLLSDVHTGDTPNELVKALAADLATPEARAQLRAPEFRGMSPEQARAQALEALRRVGALLDRKTTAAEAGGFKRWLLSVGERVAGAAKEGGFLGIGGTRVSERETAALQDAAAALGLPWPALGTDHEAARTAPPGTTLAQ